MSVDHEYFIGTSGMGGGIGNGRAATNRIDGVVPSRSLELKQNPTEVMLRKLPDNLGSHLMVGMLFGFGMALTLVHRPTEVLRSLVKDGPNSIRSAYRKFYTNTRPQISY